MSGDKKTVLIVDDSAIDIQFVLQNIKDEYAVLAATSGQAALEMVNNGSIPDVILMDVMMPEMDGYETCRQFKQNEFTKDIDVIFVSAHDSAEEKMTGYEAGGSDYLIKPVNSDELLHKVNLSIERIGSRQSRESEKEGAMLLQNILMNSAGELGVILNFMKESFSKNGIDQMAELLLSTTAQYDLNCVAQIRSCDDEVTLSSDGSTSPLELELVTRSDGDRLKEYGKRLLVCYPNCTLLVKNLPIEDETDMAGRLRDHLAIIISSVHEQVKTIDLTNANSRRKDEIYELVSEYRQTLDTVRQEQIELRKGTVLISDRMMANIETSFSLLHLTDEQEENLIEIAQTGVNEALEYLESGQESERRMGEFMDRIKVIADR